MGALANTLNALGLFLLAHAVYSAYEAATFPVIPPGPVTTATPSSTSGTITSGEPKFSLPIDITIETLVSILLLCLGIVLGAPDLKPIQWREWAGMIEKEKQKPLKNLDEGFGGNPYIGLEQRIGFLDIRAERKMFAQWVKDGGS